MSDSELVMNSEKEDIVSSTSQGDEQAISESSPEGVFSNEGRQIFEEINQQNDDLPLQEENLKDGEEIVDEEQTNVIEQEELIEEDQQYPDAQHDPQFMNMENMVHITQEDIYEAGFDVEDLNHLTEEQLNMVVAVSQQRQEKQNGPPGEEDLIHHEIIGNEFEEGTDNTHLIDNDMHLILTNDGGVNITDSKQRQFYISPAEIENLNIDLNNFNHDHVQQLLQLALPTIKETEKNDESNYNREVLDQAPSTSYHHHHHHHHHGAEKESRSPMIGETVQIRTADGSLQDAVVKYHKGNSEFKIQFMDGAFAYATVDQMLVPERSRGDHDHYQVATPMLLRRSEMARMASQKRAASSSEDLCPPILKRSYQLAPVVDGPHAVNTPNFCCPICDKKVFQKEPSYIVIRLPACDACTRQKIIVLDEPNS